MDFTGSFHLDIYVKNPGKGHIFHIAAKSGLPQTYTFRFFSVGKTVHVFGALDAEEYETLRRDLVLANGDLNNSSRELHRANAELKGLNALKNQFLGMAAHDLRKPAHIIQSYSEFLIDELGPSVSEEHKKFLAIIQRTGNTWPTL